MANELVDDYFILKSNNYFKFYKKLWMVVSIKMSAYPGRYTQKKDTLFLTWMDGDPKKISPYLSNKCIIDSISKELWFLDDLTGVKVKSMTLRANK